MADKERVTIYIDGSNFYHYLKDKEISFPKGIKFDFKKLEYVGFSHAPSFGIQKYANFSKLLLPSDIDNFKA
ncbi:MAG: hypothetical protein ABIJ28_03530 [Patescibacteria group bacterium]